MTSIYKFKGRSGRIRLKLVEIEPDGTYLLTNIYNKDLIYKVKHPEEELEETK